MVQQRGPPPPSRDFYPSSRDAAGWTADRNFDRGFDNVFSDPARYNNPSPHPRSLSIESALKGCVGMQDVKEFGLFVLCENGEAKTYSSQSLTPYQQSIFDRRFRSGFHNAVRQANIAGLNPAFSHESLYGEYDGGDAGRKERKPSNASEDSSSGDRRRRYSLHQEDLEGAETSAAARKRQRGRYVQFDDDEPPKPIPTISTQQLRIGDDDEVYNFYVTRLKDMQQNACKIMGKAFVKLVEPKKQTHYPYTKGSEKSPPWWPNQSGENSVRHKEPDHLLKAERIRLLAHILLMIVEPRQTQQQAVQKLGLNVKKLEDVTFEAMNNWFNDKDHPANAQKRPFLKEIFKVAKQQERYKNGEIDSSCKVNVMSHENIGSNSDDEADGGESFEENQDGFRIPTPESLVSPNGSMVQGIQPGPRPTDVSRNREIELVNRQRSEGWRPLPVRYNTQPHTFGEQKIEEPQLSPFQPEPYRKWDMNPSPAYPQATSDPGQHAQYPSPQQPPQQNMFSWPSNNMPMLNPASNGPSSQPFYVTNPHPAGTGGYQLPPPPPLPNNMLPPPISLNPTGFDGIPSGSRYDTGPASMGPQLRTGSLAHPYSGGRDQHQGSFQDFLNDQGMSGYGHGEEALKDEQQHHAIHTQ